MSNNPHLKPLKRHCMVVFAHYPFAETRVQREAEALISRGHSVDVICLGNSAEPMVDTHNDVTIYRVPMVRIKRSQFIDQFLDYLKFFILAFIKLTKLTWQQRYHVVQLHNPPDFLVFTAVLPKLMGSRIILDIHDPLPEFFELRSEGSPKKFLLRLIVLQEKLSCRFADHVITVSQHCARGLIERGVPSDKCSIVMNLADPKIFHPLPIEAVPPKNNHCFRLFYHGTLAKRLGLDLVLQAINQVRNQIPEIQLTLIGGGEYLKPLQQLAAELNLTEEHVQFKPFVPAEQLPSLIATADLGVVAYRNDVFTDLLLPTKLMEYALMEVPTVVSRTSTISDYFDDTMVQFFTPGDVDDLSRCILELYTDRQRLRQLSEGIQQFNVRYNWANQSAEYVHLVKELADSSRVPTFLSHNRQKRKRYVSCQN